MSRRDRLRAAEAKLQSEAAARFEARSVERAATRKELGAGGPGAADSEARRTAFNERARLKAILPSFEPSAFERRIGSWDPVLLPPTERAKAAGRPVARLVEPGRASQSWDGFATGFLVAPDLLLTNWHVFADPTEARGCAAQFLYEAGGAPGGFDPVLALEPDRFFLADQTLDFCLVGVAEAPAGLSLGFARLFETRPKILKGDAVNIIQHPEGGLKQYAVTQNRLIDILEGEGLLHYEADTLEGSSGAPAYNSDWELVALHHASIPKRRDGRVLALDGNEWTSDMGDDQVHWIANEGIRISSIIQKLRSLASGLHTSQGQRLQALLQTIADPVTVALEARMQPTPGPSPSPSPLEISMNPIQMTFTGPVTINIQNGTLSAVLPAAPSDAPAALEASIRFDPDYEARKGYDPEFLGRGALRVPIPGYSKARKADILKGEDGEPQVLKYHHFELAMDRTRRLQAWSAVNVDYGKSRKVEGDRTSWGRDRWIPDPRIPAALQIFDADFYKPAGNIDRGHIVRREDNEWGDSPLEIEFANSDTFHWTNCTPQHEAFNQADPARTDATYQGREGVWGAFENHIQRSRKGDDTKACILSGPILAKDDPSADFGRGRIQYPLKFWKIVCVAEPSASGPELRVFGFILDQTDIVREFGIETFRPGRFGLYQASLKDIAEKTGLVFDASLVNSDVLKGATTRFLETTEAVHGL